MAGNENVNSVMSWLPAVEGSVVSDEAADGSSDVDKRGGAIKEYLAQEAVPVLTKALMELCMEKNPPPPGQTVPWLIRWLQAQSPE